MDNGVETVKTFLAFRELAFAEISHENPIEISLILLHFLAFFHVASMFSTGVDNKKVGVDNEKALELTNSTVFHRGRQ